jgi:hypothetical protein
MNGDVLYISVEKWMLSTEDEFMNVKFSLRFLEISQTWGVRINVYITHQFVPITSKNSASVLCLSVEYWMLMMNARRSWKFFFFFVFVPSLKKCVYNEYCIIWTTKNLTAFKTISWELCHKKGWVVCRLCWLFSWFERDWVTRLNHYFLLHAPRSLNFLVCLLKEENTIKSLIASL